MLKNTGLVLLVMAVLMGCAAEQPSDRLGVLAWIHFNTNVSDYEASREFYRKLGLVEGSGFPDANTVAMAEALGIETPTSYDGSAGGEAGGYLLHGEVITFGGFGEGAIDLIEFTIPRNEEPPYPRINRLGMAKAAMMTSDLQSDYEQMVSEGIEFLGAPVTRADGRRVAIFKDLDGTFYELTEFEGEQIIDRPLQIQKLGPLTINVSDYDVSRSWYEKFGFVETSRIDATEPAEVARSFGFDQEIQIRGGLLTHELDGSQIELVQWLEPFDATPPFPPPINHLGIHRVAYVTSDIEADVAKLEDMGVEFLSPITPCCTGPDASSSIVLFLDPDGTVVELAEFPGAAIVFRITRWFSELGG